ncbi:hypothetical protein [Streptosporangium sp. NBC_01756]|uniref:hypothetical protein n=1 Tax=Streptosporangium sp. NBC_01756 TaxID=2975950 RepID=UPI002DD7B9FD|nr:hypothetical protein [Streptosporangium sp. NBC_01756]WSC85605.1 hypothetical protein OIE48_35415 [Streptosporangium sp. NBC_01756]
MANLRGVLAGTPALHAACLLRDELERHGVEGDVHDGYGLALVSVWADLVIWTDGMVYRWWNGCLAPRTRQRLYAVYGMDNPAAVARAVMLRYTELRENHPRSGLIAEALLSYPYGRGGGLAGFLRPAIASAGQKERVRVPSAPPPLEAVHGH